MKTSFRIDGLPQINAALADMSKATQRNTLRRVAVKALADEFVPVAAGLAPDDPDTGGNDLKASITAGLAKDLTARQQKLLKKRDEKSFAEAFAGTADPAGVQQEFGNINHPAQSFMRPAWDSTQGAIIDNVASNLGSEVKKAADRAARRALKKAGK